jgi:hypothetical protein
LKGKQLLVFGVTHFPLPSHANAAVDESPSELQAAPPQFLPLSQAAHAPDLHNPVVPHVSWLVEAQTPCGSGVPSATAVHNPAEAVRLQLMQASVQALLQHTPWAQAFDWQSSPALHTAPIGFLPQEAFWHVLPCWVLH